MAEELTRALEHRARRGLPRGAAVVFAEAQRLATTHHKPGPVWPSGPVVAVATAVLILTIGFGIPWITRTLAPDNPPAATIPRSPAVTEPTGLFPAGERVDILVLSDSGLNRIADRYAELTSEALNREVRVEAPTSRDAVEVLDLIRGAFANLVAEAEIIVFYGSPMGLEYHLPEPNILSCLEALDAFDADYTGDWAPGTKWEPTPVVPPDEGWPAYRDVLDQIYAEIWKLREGQPTILRAHDIYDPFVGQWRDLGIEPECTAYWKLQTQTVREAAEANGAGFVSLVDIFNGPNHDQDPADRGWMNPEDPMYANEEGIRIAAEAIAAIGFEPSDPPPRDDATTSTDN